MHTARGEKSGGGEEDVGRELLMEVTTHTPFSPYTHKSCGRSAIFNTAAVPHNTDIRFDWVKKKNEFN